MFGRKKRPKKAKVKRNKKVRCWLITVGGYDEFHAPPYTAQTVALELPKKQTPVYQPPKGLLSL